MRVCWWEGEGVLMGGRGCAGGRARVCWWEGEGVLVGG